MKNFKIYSVWIANEYDEGFKYETANTKQRPFAIIGPTKEFVYGLRMFSHRTKNQKKGFSTLRKEPEYFSKTATKIDVNIPQKEAGRVKGSIKTFIKKKFQEIKRKR